MRNKNNLGPVLGTTASCVPPRGMKIKQAAEYAALSPWHVELIVRSGELPALKLSRHYTILKEDLDAYLDRHRAKISSECAA